MKSASQSRLLSSSSSVAELGRCWAGAGQERTLESKTTTCQSRDIIIIKWISVPVGDLLRNFVPDSDCPLKKMSDYSKIRQVLKGLMVVPCCGATGPIYPF